MRAAVFTFGLMILVSFISCKKDKDETETPAPQCTSPKLPGDYFPAYPGSWWEYTTNTGSIVTYNISDDYESCLEECRPVFTNLGKCIDGNDIVLMTYHGMGSSSVYSSPIYSLTEDLLLICPVSFSTLQYQENFTSAEGIPYRRTTVNADTSIVLNGTTYNDVLVVYETKNFNAAHRYYDYFAKNIGLVKRDSVNAMNDQELITIMTLGNYHVE